MKRLIGAVTIGQSPRPDVIPEMTAILGPEIEIREAGALDGLDREQIAQLAPGPGDAVLVTRLADGTAVRVAERRISPLLQEKVAELFAAGVPVVVLLCTGEFPDLPIPVPASDSSLSGRLLLRPQPLLHHVMQALATSLKLGVVVPAAEQIEEARQRWRGVGREQVVSAASPYESKAQLVQAAQGLAEAGVDVVVLDCIGYTFAMQELFRRTVGVPVILARGVVSRILGEIA